MMIQLHLLSNILTIWTIDKALCWMCVQNDVVTVAFFQKVCQPWAAIFNSEAEGACVCVCARTHVCLYSFVTGLSSVLFGQDNFRWAVGHFSRVSGV